MIKNPIYIHRIAATFERTEESGFRFVEPDYQQLIPNANLRRRMSRMVKMGVATGLACLAGRSVDAILTATGYGCLADTEKFMNSLLDSGEQMLSPTSFIQSTFNTVGAQIALFTQNHSYNTTYVHRAFSLESALIDASSCLQEGCEAVLAGAVDEMTPVLRSILGRMGIGRKAFPGEGAAFFLLSGRSDAEAFARIQDVSVFTKVRTEKEFNERVQAFLHENRIESARIVRAEDFKKDCGEYPTAMSFALWKYATELKETGGSEPVLLCNSFLEGNTFVLLKSVK